MRNFLKSKRGQTFVEYALIAAVIGLVLAVASFPFTCLKERR